MVQSIYSRTVIPSNKQPSSAPMSRAYRGISTIANPTGNFSLYDISLIKQDIMNHLHIRQGEKLENPEFGTIIWDCLFEPLTEDIKILIVKNVQEIINYDPRIVANEVIVTQYDSGIQIECELTYLPYYITEALQFRFDQANGLLAV